MLDIRIIRQNPELVEKKLQRRDPSISLSRLPELDRRWRSLLAQIEEMRREQNLGSQQIARYKQEGKDTGESIVRMQELARKIRMGKEELEKLEEEIRQIMLELPNIPHDSVPVSLNSGDKVVLREGGKKLNLNFPLLNHLEIGKELGILDFDRASKISGSQFPMYVGWGAELEWALLNYMIEVQVKEKDYQLILPPQLVNTRSMLVAGNLPKFEVQLYKCHDDNLYLIPTAEVPLTNLHRDEILREEDLPLRYAAYSSCFRREAGTYGAEERGLIRVHQFNKIELYKFVTPETSYPELEFLVQDAEDIVKRLDLPYRVTLLVTGDLAQQSAKTIDIEVWLPAQKAYYEVSSCSNCEDYQARRGNIRYRPREGRSPRYVHTLNGSGLATSRLMVAILENYQQEDGSIVIPEVLRKYLHNKEKITVKEFRTKSARKKIDRGVNS